MIIAAVALIVIVIGALTYDWDALEELERDHEGSQW